MRTTQPTPIAPALLGSVVRNLSFAETPAPVLAPPQLPPTPPKPAVPTIRVVVRIRPLSKKEQQQAPQPCLLPSTDPRTLHIRLGNPLAHRPNRRAAGKATFRFSTIFNEDASQTVLFEKTTLPLIDRLFQGSSSVVFAYGVTGSGKTWTIAGDHQHPGILPRALDVIVNSIAFSKGHGLRQDSDVADDVALLTEVACGKKRRRAKPEQKVHDQNYLTIDGTVEYSIFASYIEVYNEQVYDLFDTAPAPNDEPIAEGSVRTEPTPLDNTTSCREESHKSHNRRILKLREDASGEVYAEGQTECEIKSGADIHRLLEFGHRNRSVAHTLANEHSSRSHAIFIITLKQCRTIDQSCGPPKVFRTSSKLHIVDLAGTERSSKSNSSMRSKESSQINLSLMNLSRCFDALRKNQRIQKKDPSRPLDNVPFRNSRLTRLLQRSLTSGSAVMIANVSPFAQSADETIKALQNGASAQEVKLVRGAPKPPVLSDITNNIENVSNKGSAYSRDHRMTRSMAARRGRAPNEVHRRNNQIHAKNGGSLGTELQRTKQGLTRAQEQLNEMAEIIARKDEVIAEKVELMEAQIRENAALKDTAEELEIDLAARDKELDEMYQEKERLAEQVAIDQARFRWMEAEIREEVYKEADKLIKETQERYEQHSEALDEKEDQRRKEWLTSEMERKEYEARVVQRLSRASIRASMAAVDEVLPNLDERENSSDDDDRWSSGDDCELVSEEYDYEEEEDPTAE